MPNKSTTRQLILEAVVTCIEKYGLENVTTRKIAVEAGTNIASINYHFRSKDALIAQTLAMTIKHMLEDVTLALADADQPFEVTLRDVIRYLLEGSRRFPGISRAHLNQAVLSGKRDSVGARAMSRVFEGLVDRATRAYPRKAKGLLRLRLSQIMSSIMFNMLKPDFFKVAPERRHARSEEARIQAESYAALFLGGI